MKERPILFSGPMVSAILDGRKTQTRMIVNPQPNWIRPAVGRDGVAHGYCGSGPDVGLKSPLGNLGQRLWVKETFCYNVTPEEGGLAYWYAATDPEPEACDQDGFARYRKDGRPASPWIPSIHCPRQASRIDLEITAVRLERLQDISEEDAKKEGCLGHHVDGHNGFPDGFHPRDEFRDLWQSIYGTDSWTANPWVWVYEFRRVKP